MKKKVPKFLYLDDEKDDLIGPIVTALNDTNLISVTRAYLDHLESLSKKLIDQTLEFDGFIFDLQLSGTGESTNSISPVNANGEAIDFTFDAPSIAQHLRTSATKKVHDPNFNIQVRDIPILLTSMTKRLKEIYISDRTSHDLFDFRFLKSDVTDPDRAFEIAHKAVAIVKAYDTIRSTSKGFDELIQRNINEIDDRIFARFSNEEHYPTHEVARHILKEVVTKPGPLIDEYTLAARLGIALVDIVGSENSSVKDDWDTVLEIFEDAKYTGVFCEGWRCWWEDKVEATFKKFFSLRMADLEGKEKFELLKKQLDLRHLVVAEPIELNISWNYSTICKGLLRPIDMIEGFRVDSKREPFPWQEYEYVSLAYLKTADPRIKIHPSEKSRFERINRDL